MKIFIKKNSAYYDPVRYVLKLIEKNRNFKFYFTELAEEAEIIWDEQHEKSEYINHSFYKNLFGSRIDLKHSRLLDRDLIIKNELGEEDVFATIFYMVNCLQEIDPGIEDLDQFGRYRYAASYQSKYNSIEENSVEKLIDNFCVKLKIVGAKSKSTFFISHDIDTIYGSFIQDGFWALRKMKIGVILKLILFELGRNPH